MAFENDQAAWDHFGSDHDAEESDYYSDASDGKKFAVLQSEKHFPAAGRAYKSALSNRSKHIAKINKLRGLSKPTPAQLRSVEAVELRAVDADDAFQLQRSKLKTAAAAYALRGTAPNQVSH